MVKLILVRHGRTSWNATGRFQGQSDTELSPEGLAQAEQLAAHFPVDNIAAVYSSPLKRALHTGQTIATKFKIPLFTDIRLAEISFGLWEGLTYDQINSTWPQELSAMFDTPQLAQIPEGESFPIIQQRGMQALNDIISKHEGQTVVITAHGGILRALLTYMMHIPLDYVWRLRQDNTAVNIITAYDPDNYVIELINSTAHLGSLKPGITGKY